MIQLTIDWREVLWWMQGGMSGSHLRWSVYEDMVNRVWPQASEQERRNLWLIMRRDLGYWWRPDGWQGLSHMRDKGEGPWRTDITDKTPWEYFRRVLARFDPDRQWAVTLRCPDSDTLDSLLRLTPPASIISQPSLAHFKKGEKWQSPTATVTVRAYRWQQDYYIDWSRRCAPDLIVRAEQIDIPDTGEM